ncbi:hypothetical protein FKK45_04755 [Enterobacter hormaechei]|uniref:hypothetical protein n=1 Tax=Enterobacter hormaechei TaxID=158836 RepID=UPI000C1621DF|nr:hypothetical protein [Enterobacter hormaechei]MBK2953967.1 hypothetical protein [Enterobacter hormaechei]PHZ54304.1 hypothetical protein CK479_19630 [Enterobacter hormaechei]
MITFTKEQLIASAHARIEFAEMMLAGELEPLKERTWSIELELARIALASLEAKPVSVNDDMAYAFHHAISDSSLGSDEVEEIKTGLRAAFANVTAPPAPASVPEWTNEQCLEFLSIAFRHAEIKGDLELDDIRLGVKMVNGSRAAMLQGAERTNYRAIVERIAEIIHGKVTDIDLLTVTVKSMKDKLQK